MLRCVHVTLIIKTLFNNGYSFFFLKKKKITIWLSGYKRTYSTNLITQYFSDEHWKPIFCFSINVDSNMFISIREIFKVWNLNLKAKCMDEQKYTRGSFQNLSFLFTSLKCTFLNFLGSK